MVWLLMRMVILDGYTVNPGDTDWSGLEALGDLTIYERSPEETVVERSQEAEVVFTNKSILSGDSLRQLPQLKYIGVLATGYNVVDIPATKELGIPVCNVSGYSNQSVAQLVFAHILNHANHVALHSEGVHQGKWSESIDFCYWDTPQIELDGQILGIVGLGAIGKATARIAQAMGMQVIATTRDPSKTPPQGIRWVSKEQLFAESDVISLHCPLTPETQHMINPESLSLMKPSAFLVNTGRGPLVNEQALADALNEGRIAGAGIDVLDQEPPRYESPLFGAKNCSITPHIAWATLAARQRLIDSTVENLEAFLRGETRNRVN